MATPAPEALARLNARYRELFEASALQTLDSVDPLSRRPGMTYLICFGERSGSTMLSSLMHKTNVLGRPDEFLNPRGVMQRYIGYSHAHNIQQYFSYLHAKWCTPNRVFGIKVAYVDFAPVFEAGLVDYLFDTPRVIYLNRQDLLRQAVSLAMATRTGVWFSTSNDSAPVSSADVELNEQLVLQAVDKLRRDRESWEAFFTLRRIEPLRVTYEDITADPKNVLASIAKFLAVDLDPRTIPSESEYRPQANSTNENWVSEMRKRYNL